MAQKVLIMGESGTGKSTSMRNCDPAITAVVFRSDSRCCNGICQETGAGD